jgi:hypothetical protein
MAADAMDAGRMAEALTSYLQQHPEAALLEDGRVLFDLRRARYAVSEAHGRCLLQFWSDEQNLLRTVVGLEERAQCLRVATRRMGVARPQTLELVPNHQKRTPTTRESGRKNYLRLLERVLARNFVGAKLEGFRSAMDLEHSFGPAYVRGRIAQGPAASAVIGVSSAESAAIIDGILTLGLLWLDYSREHAVRHRHVGGLKVIVPEGCERVTAERMAWLNHGAARFELYTLNERGEELQPVELRDSGNLEARLVHAFSHEASLERCREGIERVLALVPDAARARVELRPRSSSEVALLAHGLAFARVRHGVADTSFTQAIEVSFGAGPNETLLRRENEAGCRDLLAQLFVSRHPDGARNDALYRLQPEHWLESELRQKLGELLPGLREEPVYEQVPALSSGDRGLLDLLALDREGRLTVLELKADEDLHLPLQALDYWMRVRALNRDRQPVGGAATALSAFARSGYFPGCAISERDPRLLLVAPALRIHPANQPVLKYFSPQVAWELIALGEQWRRELRIIFRKRSTDPR